MWIFKGSMTNKLQARKKGGNKLIFREVREYYFLSGCRGGGLLFVRCRTKFWVCGLIRSGFKCME